MVSMIDLHRRLRRKVRILVRIKGNWRCWNYIKRFVKVCGISENTVAEIESVASDFAHPYGQQNVSMCIAKEHWTVLLPVEKLLETTQCQIFPNISEYYQIAFFRLIHDCTNNIERTAMKACSVIFKEPEWNTDRKNVQPNKARHLYHTTYFR